MAQALDGGDREPEQRRSRPYAGRFRLAYAALALLLAAAAAGLVLLLARPGLTPRPAWSAWQPTGTGLDRANEIAAFVSRQYRLPSGSQLVAVRAGPPLVQNVPITTIALSSPSATGTRRDISVLPAQNSIVYVLCGLGPRCAIREGKASRARLRLLERETLELALYTFAYMSDVDSVIAFLPPRRGDRPTLSMFFRRSELEAELERPLRETLPGGTTPGPASVPPGEAVTISRLTDGHLFRFQFQPLADGGLVLVLDPPTA